MDLPLPPISVPFTLPIEIPLLAHPPLVHFAIVLPLVVLVLEIINSFAKKKTLSVINIGMLFMIMIIMIGAFFTGKTDGTEAYDLLSKAGKETLGEHKLIGAYLLYFSIALFVIKLISAAIRKGLFRMIYMLLLAGFVAFTFYQGKEGGELVFKHGASVAALATAEETIFDLKDEMGDLQEELKEYADEAEESESETPAEDEATEDKAEDTTTPTDEATEDKAEDTTTPTEEATEVKAEESATPKEEATEEKAEESATPTEEATEVKAEESATPKEEATEEKAEENATPKENISDEKVEETEKL